MRLKLYSLIALAALAAATVTQAQDAKNGPLPSPPLVAPVPEYADWTVTIKYPPDPPQPPHAPKRHDWRFVEVHSTKVGKLRRDLVTSRDGIKSEKWFVESMLLWTTPEGKVSVSESSGAPAPDSADPNPSVVNGFPGVAWIGIEYYAGVVLFNEEQCFHYVHYVNGDTEAWINVESKLPVAYKNAGILYQFKFNPPPVEPLTLPPAYQKALDALNQMRNQP